MWVVVKQFKILKLEVVDVLHARAYFNLWQSAWGARELHFGLLDMVRVEV